MNQTGGIAKHLHVPPVCLLIAAVAMGLLDRIVPIVRFDMPFVAQAGAILIFAGIVWVGLAAAQMLKRRAAIHPHDAPTTLVVDGLFTISRNPIYLGMLMALSGWAMQLASLAPFAGPPVFAWWITQHFIRPEEQRLEAAFGAPYEAYRRQVRRWL